MVDPVNKDALKVGKCSCASRTISLSLAQRDQLITDIDQIKACIGTSFNNDLLSGLNDGECISVKLINALREFIDSSITTANGLPPNVCHMSPIIWEGHALVFTKGNHTGYGAEAAATRATGLRLPSPVKNITDPDGIVQPTAVVYNPNHLQQILDALASIKTTLLNNTSDCCEVGITTCPCDPSHTPSYLARCSDQLNFTYTASYNSIRYTNNIETYHYTINISANGILYPRNDCALSTQCSWIHENTFLEHVGTWSITENYVGGTQSISGYVNIRLISASGLVNSCNDGLYVELKGYTDGNLPISLGDSLGFEDTWNFRPCESDRDINITDPGGGIYGPSVDHTTIDYTANSIRQAVYSRLRTGSRQDVDGMHSYDSQTNVTMTVTGYKPCVHISPQLP